MEKTVEGYPADNYTQWACDYIKGDRRDPAKPFYLWLCYGSIHGPSKPAERHKGTYKDAKVPLPADIFPPRPGKPDYLTQTQAWIRGEDGQPYAGRNDAEQVGGDAPGKPASSFAEWVRRVTECVPAIDSVDGAPAAVRSGRSLTE